MEAGVKTKSRTEITIETQRILIIRTCQRLGEGWCERCQQQTPRLSLQTAAKAGVNAEAIFRHVDEGRLHFSGYGDGLQFICLATLRP